MTHIQADFSFCFLKTTTSDEDRNEMLNGCRCIHVSDLSAVATLFSEVTLDKSSTTPLRHVTVN